MNIFLPADILIPDVESMEKWSVIACDQFSSQPEYWNHILNREFFRNIKNPMFM